MKNILGMHPSEVCCCLCSKPVTWWAVTKQERKFAGRLYKVYRVHISFYCEDHAGETKDIKLGGGGDLQ